MTITRNINGSITLSTVYKDRLVQQTYYGFSHAEAREDFKQLLETL